MSKQQPILLTVRRVDGAFHVTAHEPGLEHTHRFRFSSESAAYGLVREIRMGLTAGADLCLDRHWSTDPVDESTYRELRREQFEQMRMRASR